VPAEASDSANGWIGEVLEELDRDADENAKAADEESQSPENLDPKARE
jgi:hypothetical protein